MAAELIAVIDSLAAAKHTVCFIISLWRKHPRRGLARW